LKKLSVLIFLILCTSYTRANHCTIKGPQELILSKQTNQHQLEENFVFNHCNQDTKSRLTRLIKDFRGSFTQRLARIELKNKNLIMSQSIKVQGLNEYLKDNLKLSKHLVIQNAKFVTTQKNHLALNEFDDLFIECEQCETMGKKTAKINARDRKGLKKQLWLKFNIATTIKVLRSIHTVKVTNKPLSIRHFEWKSIHTMKPEDYFTDLRNIRFYYANQVIKKGINLKQRSLSRAKLVYYGRPVVVQMAKGSLKLKGKAIPTSSGHLGDIISLKNSRTKKIIIGKIIDQNLVEVEL
jgi:flagella basal body P-ring formation protein FlgA